MYVPLSFGGNLQERCVDPRQGSWIQPVTSKQMQPNGPAEG
jgi:hypothetical protein